MPSRFLLHLQKENEENEEKDDKKTYDVACRQSFSGKARRKVS